MAVEDVVAVDAVGRMEEEDVVVGISNTSHNNSNNSMLRPRDSSNSRVDSTLAKLSPTTLNTTTIGTIVGLMVLTSMKTMIVQVVAGRRPDTCTMQLGRTLVAAASKASTRHNCLQIIDREGRCVVL